MTAPNAWKSGDGNPFPDFATAIPEPADHIAWLIQRREGVGASECAAVLGMDRWQTAFTVWLDKRGETPLTAADNEPMYWGRILEPVILQAAAERLNAELTQCAGLQSISRPWQRASLDGVLHIGGQPIPIEAKNMSQYRSTEWADDQVPDAAELQLQHQLAVTGAPYGIVAGLIGGNRLVTRTVERDDELITHINREEHQFWRNVLDGTEPPIVARDNIATILGAAEPADTQERILDPLTTIHARRWADAYTAATAAEKAAKDAKAEARNNLARLAGNHSTLLAVDGTTVIARLQRGVFRGKKFAIDYPDKSALYQKKIEVIDTAAIRTELPALYRAYQAVSVRLPKKEENQ